MRGDAAAAVQISQLERRAQFEERIPAEHCGDEGGVGFEDAVDLGEHGGEVVDPVEGEGGEDGVEGVFVVGEEFFVVEDVAR